MCVHHDQDITGRCDWGLTEEFSELPIVSVVAIGSGIVFYRCEPKIIGVTRQTSLQNKPMWRTSITTRWLKCFILSAQQSHTWSKSKPTIPIIIAVVRKSTNTSVQLFMYLFGFDYLFHLPSSWHRFSCKCCATDAVPRTPCPACVLRLRSGRPSEPVDPNLCVLGHKFASKGLDCWPVRHSTLRLCSSSRLLPRAQVFL